MSERSFARENLILDIPKNSSSQGRSLFEKKASEKTTSEEFPQIKNELKIEQWQKDVIQSVSEEVVSFFRERLNLEVPSLPLDKVHLLADKDFEDAFKTYAAGAHYKNSIFISQSYDSGSFPKLSFTEVVLHEYLHDSEFSKIRQMKDSKGDRMIVKNRQGLSLLKKHTTLQKFEWRFSGMREGTGELLKKMILDQIVSKNPFYRDEIDTKSARLDPSLSQGELSQNMGIHSSDAVDTDVIKKGGELSFDWNMTRAYKEEQELIDFITQKIAECQPDKFRGKDDAFLLFLNAQYKGELLPLAEAVDAAFGKGTFRLLSHIPENKGEEVNIKAIHVLEYLKTPPDKQDPNKVRWKVFYLDVNDYKKYKAKRTSKS